MGDFYCARKRVLPRARFLRQKCCYPSSQVQNVIIFGKKHSYQNIGKIQEEKKMVKATDKTQTRTATVGATKLTKEPSSKENTKKSDKTTIKDSFGTLEKKASKTTNQSKGFSIDIDFGDIIIGGSKSADKNRAKGKATINSRSQVKDSIIGGQVRDTVVGSNVKDSAIGQKASLDGMSQEEKDALEAGLEAIFNQSLIAATEAEKTRKTVNSKAQDQVGLLKETIEKTKETNESANIAAQNSLDTKKASLEARAAILESILKLNSTLSELRAELKKDGTIASAQRVELVENQAKDYYEMLEAKVPELAKELGPLINVELPKRTKKAKVEERDEADDMPQAPVNSDDTSMSVQASEFLLV